MIISVLSGRVKMGKFAECAQFSKELSDYISERYPDKPKPGSFVQIFGPANTLYFTTSYENLAQLEQHQQQLQQDEEYKNLIKKSADLFVEGSLTSLALKSL